MHAGLYHALSKYNIQNALATYNMVCQYVECAASMGHVHCQPVSCTASIHQIVALNYALSSHATHFQQTPLKVDLVVVAVVDVCPPRPPPLPPLPAGAPPRHSAARCPNLPHFPHWICCLSPLPPPLPPLPLTLPPFPPPRAGGLRQSRFMSPTWPQLKQARCVG